MTEVGTVPAPADLERPPSDASGRGYVAAATLAITLAATTAIALACLIGLVGQSENLKIGVFIAGFGFLLPLGAWLLIRLTEPTGNQAELTRTAATLVGGTALLLAAMRLLDIAAGPTSATELLGLFGGAGLAAATVFLSGVLRPPGAPTRFPVLPSDGLTNRPRPALAFAVVAVACLAFLPAQVSTGATVLALTVAVVLMFVPLRIPWSVPRPVAIAVDALLLIVVVLAVVDVTGYWGADVLVNSSARLLGPPSAAAQIHEHFYLGAVNDVLNGRTLLVDANGLYGVGTTYLIAGWFQLVPFGYGPFGMLGSLASAAMLIAGWLIARGAGASRVLAGIAIVVAVAATVLAPFTSPSLFLNVGGMRFLPPFLLVGAAMAAAGRSGHTSRSPWVLITFGLFSLWSIESVAYLVVTYLGLVALEALAEVSLVRALKEAVRSLAYMLATVVTAYLLLSLLTRILGGEWPDWGGYIALVKGWADIVNATFGALVEPWSRVWPMGLLCLASAIGIVGLIRSRTYAVSDRTSIGLAGVTAAGIASLSYFLSHSFDLILAYVAYPAILIIAIWVSIAMKHLEPGSGWLRGVLAFGAFVAILVLAGSWNAATDRAPRTALAHLIGDGPSLGEDLELMWDSPPIDSRALAAEQLLDQYFPPGDALVLTEPDLGEEALIRTGRANKLPISYPWQDQVDLEHVLPPVEETITELKPGTPALLQKPLKPGEALEPTLLYQQASKSIPAGQRLGPLSQAALDAIEARFQLDTIATGPGGLYVARLVPKGS